jgi:hypothetical protein
MTIHIDRLYHYVESAAENILNDRVIIYRFWPHGSKNIENLVTLHAYTPTTEFSSPQIFCNDQEPLDFEYYEKNLTYPIHNLRWVVINLFDRCVLLHSERNGQNLAKYQQHDHFVTAYYWCHAVLARDWFRYAEHVDFDGARQNPQKNFLIYNRAWSGTREYRLKLCDLLIDHDLVDDCQVTASFTDPESCVYYQTHDFKNPGFKPKHYLENYFAPNKFTSDYSADFVEQDYFNTEIEVVLETLFDDDRWHLTEKIIRPIACAQPFLLCGTPGSLQYLKSYGFETFDSIWSESYDQIKDGTTRLENIAAVMRTIQDWDPTTRSIKLGQARQIAKRNQQRFFSKMFFDQVLQELKDNLATACQQVVEHNTATKIEKRVRGIFSNPEIYQKAHTGDRLVPGISELIQQARNRHKLKSSQ